MTLKAVTLLLAVALVLAAASAPSAEIQFEVPEDPDDDMHMPEMEP